MSKRWLYIAHSGIALILGGCLYLLFREHTYLHRIMMLDYPLLSDAQFLGADLLKYYIPDFLWAYSLYYGLCAIILPIDNQWIWPTIATIGLGVVWEVGQYLSWISGTGDPMDLFMYGTAVAVAEYIFRRKK